MMHACHTLGLIALLAAVGGCEAYSLTGRVVGGPASMVAVVDADDPRLAGPPVPDASVELIIDPDSGGREAMGVVFSDESGRFTVPIDVIGAGTLEYEMMVIARAAKRSPAQGVMALPPSGRRLLIVLAPGRDRPVSTDDPFRDARDQIDQHFPGQ